MKRRRPLRLFFLLLILFFLVGGVAFVILNAEPTIPAGSQLLVELEHEFPDRAPDGWWGMPRPAVSWLDIRAQLRRAAGDPRIDGVLLLLGSEGIRAGRCEELCAAIDKFRKSGKKVRVHGESLDLASWVMGSHADEISVHPAGFLDLRSSPLMIPFFGSALERLGVRPDFLRVGDLKGMYEQFVLDRPSPELAAHLQALSDGTWSRLRAVSARAEKPSETLRQGATAGPLPAQVALEDGWVDYIEDRHTFLARVEEDSATTLVSTDTYSRVGNVSGGLESRPSIAVLSIEGTIVRGESEDLPLLGRTSGLSALRRAIREINATDSIRGVIVRIESPGGDAFASEEMWLELKRLRSELPLVALLGSQATSGGYYTAVACREIYATSTTWTGSIGIVAGRFVLGGALEKLGIQPFVVAEPEFAKPSPWEAHTETTRRAAQKELDERYQLFVDRVQSGRDLDLETTLALANGRVFRGDEALALRLLDGIGGWEEAWQRICTLAKVEDAQTAASEVFPRPRPWWTRFLRERSRSLDSAVGDLQAVLGERCWFLGPLLRPRLGGMLPASILER